MSATPSPSSWQPPPEPPTAQKRSRVGIVVLAVTAVVILAAIVVIVRKDGGDGAKLDTEAAVNGLQTYIDDEAGDDGFAVPDRCELLSERDIVDAVHDEADIRLHLDGDPLFIVSGDSNDGLVGCVFGDAENQQESASVAAFVDPHGRQFRTTRRDADGKVEDGPQRDHRGGTIESYCAEPDDGLTSCSAGWSGDGLLIFVSVAADDVEAEGVIASLVALIDPVIASLEDQA